MIRYNLTSLLSNRDFITKYTELLCNFASKSINYDYCITDKDDCIEISTIYTFKNINKVKTIIPLIQNELEQLIQQNNVLKFDSYIAKPSFAYYASNVSYPFLLQSDMIRYNVVATLASSDYLNEYTSWLTNGHIQAVTNAGGLTGEINILENSDENESTIRVASMYIFPSMNALNDYFNGVAVTLRQDGVTRFVEPKKILKFDRFVGKVEFTTKNEHNYLSPSNISPYIMFNGNCREAMSYYRDIFQGGLNSMDLDSSLPNSPILHSSLNVNTTDNDDEGIASIIMASDYFKTESSPLKDQEYSAGNNICIALNFHSYSQLQSHYASLTQNGQVLVPLAKQFWNAYFAHVADKFNINWYLNMQVPSEFADEDTKVEINKILQISPYIRFNGQCEEAMKTYQHILGGTLELMEFPEGNGNDSNGQNEGEDEQFTKKRKKQIMHSTITFQKNLAIMACDNGGCEMTTNDGNHMYISLTFSTEIGINSCYTSLSNGGKIIVPLAKPFWGGLFAEFVDKYGVQWMLVYNDQLENETSSTSSSNGCGGETCTTTTTNGNHDANNNKE